MTDDCEELRRRMESLEIMERYRKETAVQFKDLADWSGLPRDLYVTAVKSDGVVFEVQCCSVPMAIGPEVRYSMVSALYSNRENSITGDKLSLLLCPHCGGKADFNNDGDRWDQVICGGCGCRGTEYPNSREKAAAAWNRRSHSNGVGRPE